jgi:hypothetical protein
LLRNSLISCKLPLVVLGSATDSRPLRLRIAIPLLGADDLEGLVDEDVVRPADADVVDLVFAGAQLHNMIDDAPG